MRLVCGFSDLWLCVGVVWVLPVPLVVLVGWCWAVLRSVFVRGWALGWCFWWFVMIAYCFALLFDFGGNFPVFLWCGLLMALVLFCCGFMMVFPGLCVFLWFGWFGVGFGLFCCFLEVFWMLDFAGLDLRCNFWWVCCLVSGLGGYWLVGGWFGVAAYWLPWALGLVLAV